MRYEVTLKSPFGGSQLRHAIGGLADSTPFIVTDFDAVGSHTWRVRFSPRRDELAVSFRKFAELQLHLAHCGEVIELRRTDLAS